MPEPIDIILWGVLPYLVLSVLVGGTIWRYRHDQFGWTSRSSQIHESRLLRIASPLFHFGILAVIAGHAVGLLIPASWTSAVGVSEDGYHAVALSTGIVAGAATLVGIVLLIVRRIGHPSVRKATTRNDELMYVVLLGAILAGIGVTVISVFDHTVTDYRETVSVWFRSLFILQPAVEAMAAASLPFKVHICWGLALFALLPFTRLVHALTAPLHYFFRPYIVYRSRGSRSGGPGSRRPARGWEPSTAPTHRRATTQQERQAEKR